MNTPNQPSTNHSGSNHPSHKTNPPNSAAAYNKADKTAESKPKDAAQQNQSKAAKHATAEHTQKGEHKVLASGAPKDCAENDGSNSTEECNKSAEPQMKKESGSDADKSKS